MWLTSVFTFNFKFYTCWKSLEKTHLTAFEGYIVWLLKEKHADPIMLRWVWARILSINETKLK